MSPQVRLSDLPMLKPQHEGLVHAGQQLHWLGSDTPESYERLCQDPSNRNYFDQQGWMDADSIIYRINSEGFRGDEFDHSYGLLTLGCSYTSGLGLPEQVVWPYRLAQALDLPVANVSWHGWAADTCFRFGLYWIQRLQPKIVIALMPPPDRLELWLDPIMASTVGSSTDSTVIAPEYIPQSFSHDNMLKSYYLNAENSQLNRLKNRLALENVCDRQRIPCLTYCCWEAFGGTLETNGYARDKLHAGAQGHEKLTKHMLSDCLELL